MQMLEQYFSKLLDEAIYKLIISKPQSKKEPYRKIVIEKKAITISLQNIQKNRYFMKTFLLLPLLCGALN